MIPRETRNPREALRDLHKHRFSAFWLRSKCSICSYQLNIWYEDHVSSSILIWFLPGETRSVACNAGFTGWPRIAVPRGSAHFPINLLQPRAQRNTKEKSQVWTLFQGLVQVLDKFHILNKSQSSQITICASTFPRFYNSNTNKINFKPSNASGHITLNTPVLVRSPKLSNVESSQYLDGWPPGNTGCCWSNLFCPSQVPNFSFPFSR